LSVGMLTLATGGRRQWRGGVVEFYGGAATWLLRWLAADAGAMTLGHCILGQTPAILDAARSHEWVHVEQAERWGPAFLPAYLGCSAWLWCRGRRPYWDNPFEVEAYRRTD
ncbi:MAG TPA: hypothetical protein PKD86_15915, partial [Gemmatales bacterium]|nr:hypothetical protein [Gemmatales bacterium]